MDQGCKLHRNPLFGVKICMYFNLLSSRTETPIFMQLGWAHLPLGLMVYVWLFKSWGHMKRGECSTLCWAQFVYLACIQQFHVVTKCRTLCLLKTCPGFSHSENNIHSGKVLPLHLRWKRVQPGDVCQYTLNRTAYGRNFCKGAVDP